MRTSEPAQQSAPDAELAKLHVEHFVEFVEKMTRVNVMTIVRQGGSSGPEVLHYFFEINSIR
ncbi:hypothetical protein [Desulfonatronum thiosulfatophilum]|uniref:hypothetical protein n=1 Tax=Desulfonatronum thiosulfatophilum TaxID=617002 RepID=UPI001113BAF7|nr:hypothetical protein [Desulfonatronum thiosulfatophilum]